MNKKDILFLSIIFLVSIAVFFITRYYSGRNDVTVYFPDEIKLDLAGYPFRGEEKAVITIIELSDFECPYSKLVQPTLDTLHKHLDGLIKHYFKPRAIHDDDIRQLRSRAVLAAKRQNKYWEMKRELFAIDINEEGPEYQKVLKDKIFKSAKQINLNMETFKNDIDSREIKNELRTINKETDRYGLNAVPTLIIDGTIIQGKRGFDSYLDIIEKKL